MSLASSAWWNLRFLDTAGLFPIDFLNAFVDGAPGVVARVFNNVDHVAETFEFEVTSHSEDRTRIFLKRKRFEIIGGVAMERETQVHPDWQGRGIGTGLIANLIDLGQRLGLERIDVEAEDIGRYTWIGMGFLPDATSWVKHIVPAVKTRANLALAWTHIEEETHAGVMRILEDRDPRAVRNLLLLTETVPDPDPRGTEGMVPLFKVLMLQPGTEWLGSFEFKDEEALNLFAEFKEQHHAKYPKPW